MVAAPREGTPRQSLHDSWPLEFFLTRPPFDRKAENLPYIEWLKDYICEGDEVCEEEDVEDEDEDERDSDENDDDDALVCILRFYIRILVGLIYFKLLPFTYSSLIALVFLHTSGAPQYQDFFMK
jgi:hypothetical protein